MEKFRLKVDARKFFDEKYHKQIFSLDSWQSEGIPIQLLDKVERVYVSHGHEKTYKSGSKITNVSGWSSMGNEAHFEFTIKVNDIENSEYQKVNTVELMDEIQTVCNKYFKENH